MLHQVQVRQTGYLRVKLVAFGNNSFKIAIAQSQRVGRMKRLSGRRLWLKQTQRKQRP